MRGLFAWSILVLSGTAAYAVEPERISSEFVVPTQQVMAMHEASGLSYEEIRICLLLSKELGVGSSELMSERARGRSFEQIAQERGANLNEVLDSWQQSHASADGEDIRDAVRGLDRDEKRAEQLGKRYGYTRAQVMDLRRLEPDYWQLERALYIASRSGQDPVTVIERHRKGESYAALEAQFGIDPEIQGKPAWDSPSNPFVRNQWFNLGSWNFSQNRYPGFAPEQLDGRREKPQD